MFTCHHQGFTQVHLETESGHFAGMSLQQYPMSLRISVVNTLLAQKKLNMFTKADRTMVFKLAQAADAK